MPFDNLKAITTAIWREEAHPDDVFTAKECFLRNIPFLADNGILNHAGALEIFYFGYTGVKPQSWHTDLLNKMAVAAMTIGPRSYPSRAAIAAGAGESTVASMAIAAIAAGAGQLGGAHEMVRLLKYWNTLGLDIDAWNSQLKKDLVADNSEDTNEILSVWPRPAHPPGHNPNSRECSHSVITTIRLLSQLSKGEALPWLAIHREALELSVNMPLTLVAVIAAGFHDLGFQPPAAEFFWLWMQLMAAGLHGIEQLSHGPEKYPLFPDGIRLQT